MDSSSGRDGMKVSKMASKTLMRAGEKEWG
jgi:hypothetical protein